MLNRRLIRVKVFQSLYAYLQDDEPSLTKSKSYLKNSIEGIDHNFQAVLVFPLEMIHYIRVNHNPAENKYLLNENDSNAYKNLSFQGLYEQLVQHPVIKPAMEKPFVRWQDNQDVLRAVYKEIRKESTLEEYLNAPDLDEKTTQKFFLRFTAFIVERSKAFAQEMEEVNMLWEDEHIPIKNALHQFFKSILNDEQVPEVGVEEADWEFAETLMDQTIEENEEYINLIDKAAPKWDKERIARTDLVLMSMALAELLHFPYIPVKVTLNEYLELAKNYSTPQSSRFINGVLDRLVKQFRADNKLVKKGRGLVG